jgi:hypothetical protein
MLRVIRSCHWWWQIGTALMDTPSAFAPAPGSK